MNSLKERKRLEIQKERNERERKRMLRDLELEKDVEENDANLW